jgi:hypothetical protein
LRVWVLAEPDYGPTMAAVSTDRHQLLDGLAVPTGLCISARPIKERNWLSQEITVIKTSPHERRSDVLSS